MRKQKNPKTKSNVFETPEQPISEKLTTAFIILEKGIDSVNSLSDVYNAFGRTSGRPAHQRQDLLRAMLVMAGAALDSTVKQVIKNCLLEMVNLKPEAMNEAEKYVSRRLLKNLDQEGGSYLAKALLSDSPKKTIVDFMVTELTEESLQSRSQMEKATSFLGIKINIPNTLEPALKARNQIIHEMDAESLEKGQVGKTKRRLRKQAEMRSHAKSLLQLAVEIVCDIDRNLSKN